MGTKAGAAALEAAGGGEVADRDRIAAGVAHQLFGNLEALP
jgi:hypothetical protein